VRCSADYAAEGGWLRTAGGELTIWLPPELGELEPFAAAVAIVAGIYLSAVFGHSPAWAVAVDHCASPPGLVCRN
jgi:hypothetical protein